MELGFETIGNATLVFYEDGQPVLATDPWLTGTCYYGSWGLERPLTARERDAVTSAQHIWISHGHPDHLHPESLDLITRDRPILLPDHYSSEIRDSLQQRGFKTKILRYREWYQLSENTRCLCLDNENQDAILLIQAGDALVINLNDSPLCGEDRFIRSIVRKYERRKTYLAALCAVDADMLNIVDTTGRRVIDLPDRYKPGMIWETARKAARLGVGNYVCSSSQHVYLRADSEWANPYRITWTDIQRNWSRPQIRAIEPFVMVQLDTGAVSAKTVSQTSETAKSNDEASVLNCGDDDYSHRLSESEWLEIELFFKKFETLRKRIEFIELDVGGEHHRIFLKDPRAARTRMRGFTFHVPRTSLLATIRSGYFDDLLIGNFMQTELHNASLYPWFTPLVAKLGGNAKVFTISEWRRLRLHYIRRNPTAYLCWQLERRADAWLDTVRWMATRIGVKGVLKRVYRRMMGDPVLE